MKFTDLSLPPELIARAREATDIRPQPHSNRRNSAARCREGRVFASRRRVPVKHWLICCPSLRALTLRKLRPRVVIVAPTHELAIQIHRQSCELALNAARAIRSVLLIGGTATDRQIDKLKTKPHVVVGSPGRIVWN